MPANVVRAKPRWHISGQNLMGYLRIEKPNGEVIIFGQDGSKTLEKLEKDLCDKCETWQDKVHGRFVTNQGEILLWLCETCK